MPRSSDGLLAQRTTGRVRRPSEHKLVAMAALPFSQLEEEFFRAGDEWSVGHGEHDFSDLDAGYQRKTIWRVLFGWLFRANAA